MSKTPSKTVFLPWSRNACSQQFYSDAKIIGLLHLIALLQIDIYIYIYIKVQRMDPVSRHDANQSLELN
jgi:hypothetical protein